MKRSHPQNSGSTGVARACGSRAKRVKTYEAQTNICFESWDDLNLVVLYSWFYLSLVLCKHKSLSYFTSFENMSYAQKKRLTIKTKFSLVEEVEKKDKTNAEICH